MSVQGGIHLKRLICAVLLLMMVLLSSAYAEEMHEPFVWSGVKTKVVRTYESEDLCFTIHRLMIKKRTTCYVTTIWMKEPGRQVKKAAAEWGKSLAAPSKLAKKVPEAAVVINGSGYINQTYPEIPETYPGTSEDYYNTSYGSLVITDGEIFRNLEDVPFYGVVLNAEGLRMYAGVLPEEILQTNPISTWSFYDKCVLINDYEDVLDRAWDFAEHKATRTILASIDRNNYVILTATNNIGLRLTTATDFLMEHFHPQWAYNLDGGPSSDLFAWKKNSKKLRNIFGTDRKDFDVMCFCPLPQE